MSTNNLGKSSVPPITGETLAALVAAESILRYVPDINTSVGGTRPAVTTRRALEMVREQIEKASIQAGARS